MKKFRKIIVDQKMIDMFEDRVFKASPCGCHYWIGHTDGYSYGDMKYKGVFYRAHRLSYEIHKGSTSGLLVCHHCDNPICVNPDHLFLGTDKDNSDDRAKKGRHLRGDKSPTSKLTSTEVMEIYKLCKAGIKHSLISEQFNVHKSHVSKIGLKTRWAHIN